MPPVQGIQGVARLGARGGYCGRGGERACLASLAAVRVHTHSLSCLPRTLTTMPQISSPSSNCSPMHASSCARAARSQGASTKNSTRWSPSRALHTARLCCAATPRLRVDPAILCLPRTAPAKHAGRHACCALGRSHAAEALQAIAGPPRQQRRGSWPGSRPARAEHAHCGPQPRGSPEHTMRAQGTHALFGHEELLLRPLPNTRKTASGRPAQQLPRMVRRSAAGGEH